MENSKTILVVLALALVVSIFGNIYIATYKNYNPSVITVVGEGKVKTAPQLVQFNISYATTSSTAQNALNLEKIMRQKIINLLGAYGVSTSDVQVAYPQAGAVQVGNGISYQAANTLIVKMKQVQNIDQLINQLYTLGSLTVNNIVFTTSDPRAFEDQAITQAVQDGMARAQKLAATSGRKLGRLVSITGQQTQAVGTVTRDAGSTTGTNTGTATPGQIEITRDVSLVYELQ